MFFNRTPNPQNVALDEAIARIMQEMTEKPVDSEEYEACSEQLIKLMKLKKELNPSWRPSPDALVGVAGSLVSILVILNFERFHVITSKAMSFVRMVK